MADSGYQRIYARLVSTWGELIGPDALWRELGYRNAAALRTARRRGLVPLTLFRIERRRGYYARSADVAAWLSSIGGAVAQADPAEDATMN